MSDEYDEYEAEEDEPKNVTDKQLAILVDGWLDDARQDRYDEDDDEWMEPVYEKTADFIRDHMHEDERIARDAKRLVRSREGQAVKAAHNALRKIARGEVPLGWPGPEENWTDEWKSRLSDLLNLPLKVGGGQKVKFCAMSPEDWQDWRLESQRLGDEDAKRRIEEREGAKRLETLGKAQGVARTDEIRWAVAS